MNASTIAALSAAPELIARQSTFALLIVRAISASATDRQRAAYTPPNLLAAMLTPMPVMHASTPTVSARPRTRRQTRSAEER